MNAQHEVHPLRYPSFSLSRLFRRTPALLMGVGIALSALADITTLSIADSSVTAGSATTMDFAVTRSGDSSYDVYLDYQTQNGSAVAGTDYTDTSGHLLIPAGSTSATIQVPVAAGAGADKTFLLNSTGATGVGPDAAFSPPTNFAAGGAPSDVASGDFNGDGKTDLAVANFSDSTVSIFSNNAAVGATTPSYAGAVSLASGAAPRSIAVGDFNGDGKLDIATANVSGGNTSVFQNTTATGTSTLSFAAAVNFSIGAAGSSGGEVAVGDFNGDGRLDLAVTNQGLNQVAVLLNLAVPGAEAPAFAAAAAFSTGTRPVGLAISDFNVDGKPDLATSNASSGNASVLLNTTVPGAAEPGFTAAVHFTTGSSPFVLAAGDVNGDGKPDIAAANLGGNNVSILLNTAAPGATTPSYAAATNFAAGSARAVAFGDVNGDGKPDLAVANATSNTLSVLLNTTIPGATRAGYTAAVPFAIASNPVAVAVADVDGDGRADLVVTNSGSNDVAVLLNASTVSGPAAQFAVSTSTLSTQPTGGLVAGDFNLDGLLDVAAAQRTANTVAIMLNTTGAGAATASFALAASPAVGTVPRGIESADFNGDGKPDLATANASSNNVSILFNTSTPGAASASFDLAGTVALSSQPRDVTSADFNADGLVDLAVSIIGNSTIAILINTTAPAASTASFTLTTVATGGGPSGLVAADFNGDGKMDLASGSAIAAPNGRVLILLNTTSPGAATPSFSAVTSLPVGSIPNNITAADFNGDGLKDLATGDAGSSTVTLLFNTTTPGAVTPSFANAGALNATGSPIAVEPADFNGDGKLDLAVAIDGSAGSLGFFINNTSPGASTASFAAPIAAPLGGRTQNFALAVGDFNRDGSSDAAASTTSTDAIKTALNTRYQTNASTLPATGTIHYPPPVTLSLSSSSLSFGNQVETTSSDSQRVTVTNTSSNPLTISAVNLAGTNAGEFTRSTGCLASAIAPSGTCAIDVLFAPGSAGAKSASVSIVSNAASNPDSIPLSGTGVAAVYSLTRSAGNTSFANQLVNTTSSAQQLTIQNNGNIAIGITGVTASGTNPADFAIPTSGNACNGQTLAVNATCTLSFTFTPGVRGSRSADEVIATGHEGTSLTLSLTGTGTQPGVMLSPASTDFGNQVVGSTSTVTDVTLTNDGNSVLTLASIAITGDYSQTNDCPATLAASAFCTLRVSFSPTAPGSRSGSLSILSDGPNSPNTVPLLGNGIQATMSVPATSALGNQTVGTTSSAQTVTVTNSGTATLNIGTPTLGGTNAGNFAINSNGCTSAVAPGGTCAISLTFTPSAAGSRSATLSIPSNAPSTPNAVALSGTGLQAALTVASGLNFDQRPIGNTSPPQSLTVTNSGTAPLTFVSVTISGSGMADYAVSSNNCTASIAPGASCAVAITFTPGSNGSRNANVVVTSNAPSSPNTITLSGTGASVTPGDEAPAVVVVQTPGGSTNVIVGSESGAGSLSWTSMVALLVLLVLRSQQRVGKFIAMTTLAVASANATAGDLSYRYADLRYLDVSTQNNDIDADGLIATGSWSVSPHLYLGASYGRLSTGDFTFMGVTGSSTTNTAGLSAGWRQEISSGLDAIGSVSLISVRAKSGGGFTGSTSDTGYGLEAGLRGRLNPTWEWSAAWNYAHIFSDHDNAATAQLLHHLKSRWSVVAGLGRGSNSTQFNLGLRVNLGHEGESSE